MKTKYIALLTALMTLGAMAYYSFSRPAPPVSIEHNLSFKHAVKQPVPIEPVEEPVTVESVNVIAVQPEPVQILEERGDAMLFEIDALRAMPFDQAIIMPFE